MFLLFTIWRIVDIVITLIAPHIIPYLGFFPYKDLLVQYHLPDFLSHLASFDGVHYTQIADNGYAEHEQAFFPLYPLLIKGLTFITQNRLVSGLIISNVAFLFGIMIFFKYLSLIGVENPGIPSGADPPIRRGAPTGKDSRQNLSMIVIFLLLFPTSFFFGAVYTEGLFFFLFIASLYFLKKKNYWVAGIFAGLSSATRLMGIFLIIPFLVSFLTDKSFNLKRYMVRVGHYLFLIFSPLIGFIMYSGYLWKTTGDPLYFFNAQPSFGANRSTHLILLPQVLYRYIKIFITASWNFQYFTSLIEFVLFGFIFVVLIFDLMKFIKFTEKWKLKIGNYDRFTLNLFSFINLLLPTLTGTFSSIPRYALMSVSMFLYLGEIRNAAFRTGILISFFILHAVLLGFFIQGYFVG
ncbi:hypothetical protein COY90_01010 [Candidatus Roizmanbacteria bacterium CG_4_10_14_0_8_um_filter_39_9]|uniref:Glycosyltransferase RgtA/B/C/D-like domain-containing protein n=1 Tax=Candidatus Roizmanbacteria bacterium CG_4_10_14_0_8_um_filter_39_9 TaxID=1974829 RepID=A0A2M7QDR9_9BACT|nr:MAG: hypothetical protein COY90_01010 [Candidatus Roizmanbacteria bacterium CG_4_10_14_0_8_um_filter_39_9]